MKGALLFAFNNGIVDYYKMACNTAERINYFLELPVTIVTDKNTKINQYDYKFDNVIVIDSDSTNKKGNNIWINKNRYQAFEISPYDETLLLDTDFLINSKQLLYLFDTSKDYYLHKKTNFLFHPVSDEYMSTSSFETFWATVIFFKKTKKAQQLFDCVKMVQQNYHHYAILYNMISTQFRNDFAFTIAHRIVNGNMDDETHCIPWKLTHAGSDLKIYKLSEKKFNTEYISFFTNLKGKQEYIIIRDLDFHCMNKNNFMEIV